MKKTRRVRWTISNRPIRGEMEIHERFSQFAMADEPVMIRIKPQTGDVTVIMGSQISTKRMETLGLPFTGSFPSGDSTVLGKLAFPIVPDMDKVMLRIIEYSYGVIKVHIVDVHGTSKKSVPSLQNVFIPYAFGDLEVIEIDARPID